MDTWLAIMAQRVISCVYPSYVQSVCCLVVAKSIMAVLNASLEHSIIDTRRAISALSSTKRMLDRCSTRHLNTLSDHLGISSRDILSDSFNLYFSGCFSLFA